MMYVTVNIVFRNYQLKLIPSFQVSGAPFQEISLCSLSSTLIFRDT